MFTTHSSLTRHQNSRVNYTVLQTEDCNLNTSKKIATNLYIHGPPGTITYQQHSTTSQTLQRKLTFALALSSSVVRRLISILRDELSSFAMASSWSSCFRSACVASTVDSRSCTLSVNRVASSACRSADCRNSLSSPVSSSCFNNRASRSSCEL